ncbi:GSCOCG00012214001-RA-CDS [Cotesia congregata]|nr:GSCOCG00012214001-RA-CDS [Cotesia congregata]
MFHLVHRPQEHPLITEENSPQFVMVPIDSEKYNKDSVKINFRQKIKEQEKYGMFINDHDDYLRHLKDTKKLSVEWKQANGPSYNYKKKDFKELFKLNLPSSIFASSVKKKKLVF